MSVYYLITRQSVGVTAHGVVGRAIADTLDVFAREEDAREAFECYLDTERTDTYDVDMDDKKQYLVRITLEKITEVDGEIEETETVKEGFDVEFY